MRAGRGEIIVDSFAGGGGASLGIERAIGRSPDIAINHDEAAIAMHAANHPATRHLQHNVWKVDPLAATGGAPVGLMWASPDCFPAGSLVLTPAGYAPIEEIEVGDLVLTHKGRWRLVTETSSAQRPLVTLRGHGHPGLTLSVEHPVWARRRLDVWSSTPPRGYRRYLDMAEWTPAAMLDKGWYWASPVSFPQAEIPEVGGRGFPLDLRLLWLAGRYLGDGWTRLTDTRAEVVITCGKHEVEGLRSRLSVWPREGARSGPGELTWHERATGTAYQFTANHRGLVEWLREHFGHRAESKRIPGWALGLPEQQKEALVAGYLSADGWRAETFSECRTVSAALAFGMKALLGGLGKVVIVHKGANGSKIEGREVAARPIYMLRWRHVGDAAHEQVFREDLHHWAPIREQIDDGLFGQVFNIGVDEDESYVVEGVVVHNCKHFSKAKGGKPVARNIRDLAWVVVSWARQVRPRVICLENVEEFRTWGPLNVENRPDPKRRGETFRRWVGELHRLGYRVEHRELRACDYGAPTIRKRLFLIARCDGLPIVWPKPSHGDPKSADVKAGRLKPWRTAAEIIDWSRPCPSIFLTAQEARALGVKRPLAEATMARIAKGVKRYVLDAAEPFVVTINHSGEGFRGQGLDEPFRTVAAARDAHGLVAPVFAYGQQGGAVRDAQSPMSTVTASAKDTNVLIAPHLMTMRNAQKPSLGASEPTHTITSGGAHLNLVAAHLTKFNTGSVGSGLDEPAPTVTANSFLQRPGGAAPMGIVSAHCSAYYGDGDGSTDRSAPADEPLRTVTTENRHAVVAAFLAQHNSGVVGHEARDPVSTVTQTGSHQAVVSAGLMSLKGSERRGASIETPHATVTAQGCHSADVRAFLVKYYGEGGQDQAAGEPLHTIPTRDRFGLVTIAGEVYEIADIGMRMLTPRELFRAQGFPDSYDITTGPGGRRLTQAEQIGRCGNSVCPDLAEAIVAANYRAADARDFPEREFGPLFVGAAE